MHLNTFFDVKSPTIRFLNWLSIKDGEIVNFLTQ